MPRYCAVRVCRNRGGTASRQDNKRISFYPFPLQDKSRLQKWVSNMKREQWTPSRHQYLCSEHFTADCFDIRWGIRYLKNTAIPTIFPSSEDDDEKKTTNLKRSLKAKTNISLGDPELATFDSPASKKRPLILSKTGRKSQSAVINNMSGERTEMVFEPAVLDSHLERSEIQTAACEKPLDGETAAQSPSRELCSEEQAESTVTVLCCEPGSFSDAGANMDGDAFQAVLGQAFSFVPMELVKDKTTGCFLAESGLTDEEKVSVFEHSYCRPDTDKDELWRKILSLHAKILELDRREESTVAKIRALENEVALLKRDGAVFKEKQKV
ncbi:THAP domain-containing protein 5 [Haplochromis burtoni]|uniref:THAP domain-containing protein 5 n=1 Tax=Haplochromis burtoni TaxID=8153 RepID=A0A3Q2WG37_HAPBU|nr:THAP domain-containing protein 5 [Haplochromis burtoni]